MSIKPAKVQFNGGEISPWLEARYDIVKFDKTAKLCRNFIPLIEGSVKRRGGSRFVSFCLDDEGVSFSINPFPLEAEVVIGGEKRNNIKVARGELVNYEVKFDGYATCIGNVIVNNDLCIDVKLVSNTKKNVLKIIPNPSDAVVKIEGYERREAEFAKNSEVFYIVYKDGYKMQSGTVDLCKDMEIYVDLVKDDENEGESIYGDWGNPVAFISCSALGYLNKQYKCFLLRFENGYLPIIFDANKNVPDKIDESLFCYEDVDGYDAVVYKNNQYILCYMEQGKEALYYKKLDGNLIFAVDIVSQKALGWQVNEDGYYASYYATYDGHISGNVFKVYYKGNLVWALRGRE